MSGRIDAGGVDVGDFLVEAALGGPDVLNPARQLLEVVKRLVGILQTLIVEDEPLDDVFPQTLGGPDAELRASKRLHPVADRDDDVKVIEPGCVVFSVSGSCQGFLDN